jgi:aryl-alcohol dehydrogenase-like predicted oxidoreductase
VIGGMKYRRFGSTDLDVSVIGLGCQSLGGGLYHRDHAQSERVLREAVDAGVTFFDVSDHFSMGDAERVMGRTLKGVRDRIVLTTKAGYQYAPAARVALRLRGVSRPFSNLLKPAKSSLHRFRLAQGRFNYEPRYLVNAVENSLRRLQTDRLDLLQLYKPPRDLLTSDAVYEPLEKLRSQGKIRYYGVACVSVADAMTALRHSGNAAVQVAINCLEQVGVGELLAEAARKGMAVIARSPRATGLLTDSHEDLMGDSAAYAMQQTTRLEAARRLRGLIRRDRTLAQAAIQFVLGLDGVTVVIPRAVSAAELHENLGSLNAPALSTEDQVLIASIRSTVDGLGAPARAGA